MSVECAYINPEYMSRVVPVDAFDMYRNAPKALINIMTVDLLSRYARARVSFLNGYKGVLFCAASYSVEYQLCYDAEMKIRITDNPNVIGVDFAADHMSNSAFVDYYLGKFDSSSEIKAVGIGELHKAIDKLRFGATWIKPSRYKY